MIGKKPAKYRNKKVDWDGEKFDSKAELKRFMELRILQRAGHISDLERQPSFVLAPKVTIAGKTVRSLIYCADFAYVDKHRKHIIEDVKGMLTPMYKVKRHLMKALLNLDILETK